MAMLRRPLICQDIPRVLLLFLILRTSIAESSSQSWTQYIQEGCQLEKATTGNNAVINIADSEDFFQLFVSRLGTVKPSIALRNSNNAMLTLLEANQTVYEQPTSFRFFISNEPKVQIGLNAGENRTLVFEPKGDVRASAILLGNVKTTRNCLHGLPYSLLNGTSHQYRPVLRDGESRFVIITKKEKHIKLVLHRDENPRAFCICLSQSNTSGVSYQSLPMHVPPSNTSCVSCQPLPTHVPHFLKFFYNKTYKTLQIEGTDIAMNNSNRHLEFTTEHGEGDVYVVHDLREFDATSGGHEVTVLSVSVAALVILILIICFKRRPCRNEAPGDDLSQVELSELGRSRPTSDVRNEQCEDGDYVICEEIPTADAPDSQDYSRTPSGLQEDLNYGDTRRVPYESLDSFREVDAPLEGSNVVSFINDFCEPFENFQQNWSV